MEYEYEYKRKQEADQTTLPTCVNISVNSPISIEYNAFMCVWVYCIVEVEPLSSLPRFNEI